MGLQLCILLFNSNKQVLMKGFKDFSLETPSFPVDICLRNESLGWSCWYSINWMSGIVPEWSRCGWYSQRVILGAGNSSSVCREGETCYWGGESVGEHSSTWSPSHSVPRPAQLGSCGDKEQCGGHKAMPCVGRIWERRCVHKSCPGVWVGFGHEVGVMLHKWVAHPGVNKD